MDSTTNSPIGNSFSINPFYLISNENSGMTVLLVGGPTSLPTTTDYLVTSYGALFRGWFSDRFFAGAHVAQYELEYTAINSGASNTSHDPGNGAALGWEGSSGLSLTVHHDTARISRVTLGAVRVLIGWRFGS